jgi:serine/threonine protein kinase
MRYFYFSLAILGSSLTYLTLRSIEKCNSGFSFVYLVQDVATGRLYALKKIRCPFGSEGVQDAMKEAEMYRTFQHENVIKVMVCPF